MIQSPVKATTLKTTFRLECAVAVTIDASREKIWGLLTNAGDYPKWNSTVLGAEGTIALDQVFKIKSSLDPSRMFSLKVAEFIPPARMVWTDGWYPFFRGVRTFTLTQRDDGSTDFSRVDVFGGLLFPLVSGSLPDFKTAFESLASELKAEAERVGGEGW